MVTKYRTLALVALVIFILSCSSRNSEFHVALGDIPTRLTPDDADVDTVLYIIKQLHQPLFIASLTGYVDSQLLKSWDISSDATALTLCLKDNLKFSNNHLITVSDILANIRYFNEKKYLKYEISDFKLANNCVVVRFTNSYPDVINDLTSYKAAIVDMTTRHAKVVVGVSPYQVVEINPEVVHLHSDQKLSFKDVYFHAWNPSTGATLKEYDDINPISERYISADIKKHFNEYKVTMLKTAALIINEPDDTIRKYLFNCINYRKLREILYPDNTSFVDVSGILPHGMPGASGESLIQKCPFQPLSNYVVIKMPTFFDDCIEELQSFFDNSLLSLNIKIKVTPIDGNDLVGVLRMKDKKYGMTIIGLAVPNPQPLAFFRYFLPGETMLTNIRNSNLEQIINKYLNTSDENSRRMLVEEADRMILNNHQALPLFQVNKPLFFSKKVKLIMTDHLQLGMPDIAKL